MLDSRPKGRGFEPHRRHCVVSLSKNINPGLVLVQPKKTRPFITERLLMGRKESNQTKSSFFLFFNLIKTAAKFMRTESVKCPARAVFAKSRARHVHIMSLNLLTSHKSPLI